MSTKIVVSGLIAAAVGVAFVAVALPVFAQGGPWNNNGVQQMLHTPVAPGTGVTNPMGGMMGQGGRWGGMGNGPAGVDPATMQANHAALLPAADPAGLTQTEIDGLVYMREEEKLAHDVYATFADQWGLTPFSRIASSEQMHTDSIKTLLDRYGIADPASSEVGVFTNPDLQALYDDLIAKGSASAAEALKVGGLIEEVDLHDLDARIAANDQADIATVYANLRSASEMHLRAFATSYQSTTGTAYTAQVLNADAVATILSGANGHGNGGHGGGMGGGPRRP